MTSDDLSVNLSLTARSKEHRYLSRDRLLEYARDPPGAVYRDPDSGHYLVRVQDPHLGHNRQQHERDLFIRLAAHGDELDVVTQTSDHYDLHEFDFLGQRPDWPPDTDP
jgi:hypothetical protein